MGVDFIGNDFYFNPRPPWGGRPADSSFCKSRSLFQSTPSVGRATRWLGAGEKLDAISIHALRGEGDDERDDARSLRCRFQSTPSVGRATIAGV